MENLVLHQFPWQPLGFILKQVNEYLNYTCISVGIHLLDN